MPEPQIKIQRATRGTKIGWVPVIGKVPPGHERALLEYQEASRQQRTDVVFEAIDLLLRTRGVAVEAA